MKRILVPLDGSALSEQAIQPAAELAQAFDIALELIHVIEHPVPDLVPEQMLDPTPDAVKARLRDVADRHNLTGPVSFNVLIGDPVRRLLQISERNPDALIVMATHGRAGVVRAVVGSVADKVVRGATGPVMLVRPSNGAQPSTSLHTILIGLDGSTFAERALPRAIEIAKATGAQLHLVRVIESLWMLAYPTGSYDGAAPDPHLVQQLDESLTDDATAYLGRVASSIRKDGVDVTWDVGRGKPVDEIITAAEQASAGMIVVATHGRGGLSRVFQGSVATGLIARSMTPLMVVPAAVPGRADTVRYEPELTIML